MAVKGVFCSPLSSRDCNGSRKLVQGEDMLRLRMMHLSLPISFSFSGRLFSLAGEFTIRFKKQKQYLRWIESESERRDGHYM